MLLFNDYQIDTKDNCLILKLSKRKLFSLFKTENIFEFNYGSGKIVKDKRFLNLISNMDRLEINYLEDHDTTEYILEIILTKSKIRIFKTYNKSKIRKLGMSLAKHLKIDFIDNFPYGKELLWGGTDVSDREISHINQQSDK